MTHEEKATAALAEIHNHTTLCFDENEENIFIQGYLAAINELQPTLPGEYYRAVPVEERLPTEQNKYWCLISDNGATARFVFFFDTDTGKFTSREYDTSYTTHWLEKIEIPSTREAASRAWEAAIKYDEQVFANQSHTGYSKDEPKVTAPDKNEYLNKHYPI